MPKGTPNARFSHQPDDDEDQGRGAVQRVVLTPARSVFDLAKPVTPGKSKPATRQQLPPLFGAELRVDRRPLPKSTRSDKGVGKYDSLFDRLMQDGDSIHPIAKLYRAALSNAAGGYLQNRPHLAAQSRFLVRPIDDDHIGVWRVAVEQ